MTRLLMIFIGGGVGATLRYGISIFCTKYFSFFPIGTLIVNLLGCFLIGFLTETFSYRIVSTELKLAILTGMLGALTTFSTFGLETYHLFKQNNLILAVSNVLFNLIMGIVLLVLGIMFSRFLFAR
ncbi:MAG: fluoride efflux transporter CrcB [Spirochaetes bacterium]|nr:fluoride efflux transporter CrcB [Spirochaetota bacterium]